MAKKMPPKMAGHDDEVEDKKLIKRMVKGSCIAKKVAGKAKKKAK